MERGSGCSSEISIRGKFEVYVRFYVSTVRISGMYGLRDLPVIANIVVIA